MSYTDESPSLTSLFSQAESYRAQLDSLSYTSTSAPDYQAHLTTTLNLHTECLHIADRIALFSPNESLDDVSSSHLPYLLLPYWCAELTIKKTAPDLARRKQVIEEARGFYEAFLRRLDAYDVLGKEEMGLLERYLEDRDGFEVASGDAAARREGKIRRFRDEKELKNKLEVSFTKHTM